MEKLLKPARFVFCIALAAIASPQLIYGKFRSDFLPEWPHMQYEAFWAGLFAIVVLLCCAAVIFTIRPKTAALLLGNLLLAMCIFGYFTYCVFIDKSDNYLDKWGSFLTAWALAGGALIAANSLPAEPAIERSGVLKFLQRSTALGPYVFCTTMVLYGLSHFMYPIEVVPLIPKWMPWPMFWLYFCGGALICVGLAIVFNIKRTTAAFLLGLLILSFLLIIHIPIAISTGAANELSDPVRACGALAFSATAFMIAGMAARSTKNI